MITVIIKQLTFYLKQWLLILSVCATGNIHQFQFAFVSFRSPYLFQLLTVGVQVVYFHLITLRYTSHSVGLLWRRDRSVAETSTWQHKRSQKTNIHSPGGIRTHDPSNRSAAAPRLRLRCHWDPVCFRRPANLEGRKQNTVFTQVTPMRDFRLLLRCTWDRRSSGMLHSVDR
jgi:hypothetical protein